ncbi:hydrogenase formation protein HypD [Pseudenhygromyxa sp. WMMC2535]|uniref:hydrogenase formation protein HypD n=1 Tax=Pseudenhygromyxa sp. WMMC2535 TaxID=2712867 RepID=UPI001556F3FB|nr:hydrogenase formation protein HypD [Pseudenhygromyxa sp. WMMC2535]NVB40870.1 hydrogenase formation protein HypD [Pseudenhygromyxa sp. WMMC2535]
MKYIDEFRDPALGRRLVEQISVLAEELAAGRGDARPLKLMEVCGGHTHAIFKFGLDELLPPSIELVHGPGCPVCVLPVGRVDDAIHIASQPGVIFTTFGDALRVPGSTRSLLQAKAQGADVRTVYSPVDALAIARQNPERSVVFFGLGFETTAPSTALTIKQARAEGVDNFYLFSNHITIVPTLEAILAAPDLELDGFVGPGHVTMVIGTQPYQFICERYKKPFVVSGFEPLDVLQSILMILRQLAEGRCEVENQYARLVRSQGNAVAQAAMAEVFRPRSHFEWRGLGSIPGSGLALREDYASFDAEQKFAVPALSIADPKACQCGEVLKGKLKPWECKVFGTACTPQTPIGSCMVSSEGACAAYYNHGRLTTLRRSQSAL